jgi:hypothetical protein
VPAIFSTLCCCLPIGIVAIVFAAQVNTKLQAGDMPGALEASRKAKLWFWLAVVGFFISSAIWVLLLRHHAIWIHRSWRVD